MRKRIGILVLLVMFLMTSMVIAETYHIESLKQGEVLEFASGFTGEPIYPNDILEYLGYKNGSHSFKAREDIVNVTANFEFKEIEIDKEVEQGDTNNNGEVGTGTGGQATWEGLKMGKQQWLDEENNVNIYAIRLQADKFDRENEITVIDKPNKKLDIKGKVEVVGYKANGNVISTSDVISIESETILDDKGFAVKFMPHKDVAAYDIKYNTQYDKELQNKYVALQKGKQVVGGGTITGEVEPEDTCPVCPICPDNKDEIKELEDKIKEKDKKIEELEKEIEDLKNKKPEVIEKEVEKPVYITEVKIVEVIKEVIKEKPIYLTEVQIREIIKEVEKEVEVEKPVYITEVKVITNEIIKEVVKEVEKPSNDNPYVDTSSNGSGKTLPATGDGGYIKFIILGVILVIAGIFVNKNHK